MWVSTLRIIYINVSMIDLFVMVALIIDFI